MSARQKLLDMFRRGAAGAMSIPGSIVKGISFAIKKGLGERTFARMTGGVQFGSSSPTWTGSSRIEQVMHYKAWVGRAIDTICKLATKEPPIVGVVRTRTEKVDHARRTKAWMSGRGSEPEERRWLTMAEKKKALSVVRPHEELEHLDENHHLAALLKRPNEWDVGSDLWREFLMFMELCGIGYLWPVPYRNAPGLAELWVMPSHWVWPQSSGTDKMVDHYDIRPWGPSGRNEPMTFDADELIPVRYQSPLSKIDGASPVQQAAEIIDVDESLRLQRFYAQKIGVNIGTIFKTDAACNPTDAQIQRAEEKLFAKFAGERGFRRPAVLPPGMDIIYPPGDLELAHIQSTEQMRDFVLAMWSLSKTVMGFTEGVNRATFEGAMAAAYYMVVNPRLSIVGESMTAKLCPRAGNNLRIFWPDMTPADRAMQLQEWQVRMQTTPYRPNEFIRWCNQEELPEGDTVVEPPMMTPAGLNDDISGMTDDELLNAARGGGAEDRITPKFSTNGHVHANGNGGGKDSFHDMLEKGMGKLLMTTDETAREMMEKHAQLAQAKLERFGDVLEKQTAQAAAASVSLTSVAANGATMAIAEIGQRIEKAATEALADEGQRLVHAVQAIHAQVIKELQDVTINLPAPIVNVTVEPAQIPQGAAPVVQIAPANVTIEQTVQPAEVTVKLERAERTIEFGDGTTATIKDA